MQALCGRPSPSTTTVRFAGLRSFQGAGIWGTYPDAVLPGLSVVEGGQTSTGSVVAWCRLWCKTFA